MKIVFCGGGTAGHVTPNIALIDQLKNHNLYYIGSDGMEKQLTKQYVEDGRISKFCEISASKLKRKLSFGNLKLPFSLAKSVKESENHLKNIQPNVVFSKGGYVGLPVVIAAHKLKIPTIIHESDMSLGLANKISSKFATQTLTTFDGDKKAQTVGAIVRKSVLDGNKQKGLQKMNFCGKKPVLLVMGGSLGAGAINNAISNCPKIAEFFDVFVITGRGKHIQCDFVHQTEYVDEIADVFSASDVCLTRAGSNSLVELTLSNIPFVTVPLTKLSRGEQVKNAQWFAKKGCGLHLEENKLKDLLYPILCSAYFNRQAIMTKQKQCAHLNGTSKVLQEILKYQ